jgi:hypothetical protein
MVSTLGVVICSQTVMNKYLLIKMQQQFYCVLLLQLIISIAFNQAVKIHSLKVKAPADKGPKTIRIFINQPRTLDFDLADSYTSVQDLE